MCLPQLGHSTSGVWRDADSRGCLTHVLPELRTFPRWSGRELKYRGNIAAPPYCGRDRPGMRQLSSMNIISGASVLRLSRQPAAALAAPTEKRSGHRLPAHQRTTLSPSWFAIRALSLMIGGLQCAAGELSTFPHLLPRPIQRPSPPNAWSIREIAQSLSSIRLRNIPGRGKGSQSPRLLPRNA